MRGLVGKNCIPMSLYTHATFLVAQFRDSLFTTSTCHITLHVLDFGFPHRLLFASFFSVVCFFSLHLKSSVLLFAWSNTVAGPLFSRKHCKSSWRPPKSRVPLSSRTSQYYQTVSSTSSTWSTLEQPRQGVRKPHPETPATGPNSAP